MKRNWCKKSIVSLILAVTMIFSLGVPAFAADETLVEEVEYNVEYTICDGFVRETATFSTGEGSTSVIEKMVYENGAVETYINGVLMNIGGRAHYDLYLLAAQGRLDEFGIDILSNSHANSRANFPCGFNYEHTQYGPTVIHTYNIDATQVGIEAVLSVIWEVYNLPLDSDLASDIINDIIDARTKGAKYLDLTATEFLILPDGYSEFILCCHDYFVFYNGTPTNREIIMTEWSYYQIPL